MAMDFDQANVRTGLALMERPNEWVEAYPRVPLDEGAVGGDLQDGPAWSRRFVQWDACSGLFVVVNVSYYVARDFADGDEPKWCDGEFGERWVQQHVELTVCEDYTDPGCTELHADARYSDLPGGADPELTAVDLAWAVRADQLAEDDGPLGDLWVAASDYFCL